MAQRQFRSDDTDVWNWGFGNGSDGALTISSNTTEAPIDSSCSGTSGQLTLSATNASFATGQLILIHQSRGTGVGAWELNKIASYTAGTITLAHALTNTYTDSGASQAQVRVLKQYSSVTIDGSYAYTAKAWDGNVGGILAFFCNGQTTVTGTIQAGSTGYLRHAAASSEAWTGEGSAGTAVLGQYTANGSGGGGSERNGDNHAAGGGGGGNGATGSTGNQHNGAAIPGTGGSATGTASLVTATFGGAGGLGTGSVGQDGAEGGDGGGIIFIFSRVIVVTGAIGNGGDNGTNSDGNHCGGGGAGAGGSTLFKGQSVTIGTNLVTAPGGTGGGNDADSNNDGGNGAVGRIHVDYKDSLSGSTTPTLDSTQDTSLIDRSAGGTITAFEI